MHREKTRKMSNIVLAALLAAVLFAATGGMAAAALPAPTWMPGSPIFAGNQVILLWGPVPGAVKYNIYLNDKKIQESVSIQAIVAAPEEAGSFSYQISAVEGSGLEGPKGPSGLIKIFKLTPPKNANGRVMGNNIGLNWDPVGGAVLYNVYRSTVSGKGFELADSIQDVRWTDSKAQEKKIYYYRVTAKDSSGKESEPSAEVVVSTVVQVTEAARVRNVIGKKTKLLFTLQDKDLTANGVVRIFEPFDIKPSRDRSKYYITSVNTKSVLIMDAEGNFLKEFGGGDTPEKDGYFQSPYGVAIGPGGEVYVADQVKNNVQVFSQDGVFEKVFTVLQRREWMQKGVKLMGVDVDPSGNVYLLDSFNAAVFKYNPKGEELSHFTKRKPDALETGFLSHLRVIGDKIYLADGGFGRVVVTDFSGKILSMIGKQGSGVGLLAAMGGFDVTDDGKVFMVDRSTNLVQVYDLKGTYLFTLSNDDNSAPAQLLGPMAVSVDNRKQQVYVVMGIINAIRSFQMFGDPVEAKGK